MTSTSTRITREDIEKKLRELAGGVDSAAEAARPTLVVLASAAAVIVVVGAYLLGRRGGRKRSALVEIRRI
jgi:hypothetical protein